MPYTALSITATAILAIVFSLYFFIKKKEGADWVHTIYFIIVFVVGVALYMLGLLYDGDRNSGVLSLFTVATAIWLSLKSFFGDFGAPFVSGLAHDNAMYTVAMFAHFIVAITCSFLIAIKLFGKNVVNGFRVFYNKYVRSKYIVVGVGEYAEVFLRELDDNKKKRTTVVLEAKSWKKKNYFIDKGFAVVVINDGKDEITDEMRDALKIAGFHHNWWGTKIIAMSESDEINLFVAKIVTDYILDKLRKVKKLSSGEKKKLDDLRKVKKLSPEQKEDWDKLREVKKLSPEQQKELDELRKLKKLSPEQQKELNELMELQELQKKLEELKLSAYAMYETLDSTEHFKFAERAFGKVRFFNPHEICARKFILDNPITSLIPKVWINTEKARLKNKSENGLDRAYRIMNFFIGYGRTNQHILKKSICNYQLLGVDYNALIISKDAVDLGERFKTATPGLFYGGKLEPDKDDSLYYPGPYDVYNIKFEDLNELASDFYNKIIQKIRGDSGEQGYDFASVVIALGSDMLNIETALELRQKLYERKLLKGPRDGTKNDDRVKIFVKITDNLEYHEMLNDEKAIENEITIFGELDETINVDYVIDEKMEVIAKHRAKQYKGNIKWDTMTEFKRESNRGSAMSIRTKLNLLGFEFEECTDNVNNTDNANKSDDMTNYDKLYWNGVPDDDKNAVMKVYEKKEKNVVADKEKNVITAFVDFVVGAVMAFFGNKEKKNEVDTVVADEESFVDFVVWEDSDKKDSDKKKKTKDIARNNLASLEHQRWNTLHLVNGWTKLERDEVDNRLVNGWKELNDEKQLKKQEITDDDRKDVINKARQNEKSKQHACITTFEDLHNLREKQAGDAKTRGIVPKIGKARSIADTMVGDFNLMDKLFETLEGLNYKVTLRESTEPSCQKKASHEA